MREAGAARVRAELEWGMVREGLKEAATYPMHATGEILPSTIPGKENRVYREPVGVVGVICPWNFPFQLSNRSVSPALAAGNGVVSASSAGATSRRRAWSSAATVRSWSSTTPISNWP